MENKFQETKVEGRNAVLEAFRSGKSVDKLFVLEKCEDGPVRTILREAKKHDTMIKYVKKERLDQMCIRDRYRRFASKSICFSGEVIMSGNFFRYL